MARGYTARRANAPLATHGCAVVESWQAAEHQVYPEALRLVAEGKVRLGEDGKAGRTAGSDGKI